MIAPFFVVHRKAINRKEREERFESSDSLSVVRRLQYGGDVGVRGIPPLRKGRARMGHPAMIRCQLCDVCNTVVMLGFVESHPCAESAQGWGIQCFGDLDRR